MIMTNAKQLKPTQAEIDAIDDIAKVVVEDEGGVEM